jgi:hypothetical protein
MSLLIWPLARPPLKQRDERCAEAGLASIDARARARSTAPRLRRGHGLSPTPDRDRHRHDARPPEHAAAPRCSYRPRAQPRNWPPPSPCSADNSPVNDALTRVSSPDHNPGSAALELRQRRARCDSPTRPRSSTPGCLRHRHLQRVRLARSRATSTGGRREARSWHVAYDREVRGRRDGALGLPAPVRASERAGVNPAIPGRSNSAAEAAPGPSSRAARRSASQRS